MNKILEVILNPINQSYIQYVWCFLRVSVGILTMFHGVPKMTGLTTWHNLGTTFMYPLGIKFLPTMWGFLGALTEFLGGILLVIGLGTRISSFALIIMMIIATAYHLNRGDSFNVYSFPLTLIFVYLAFFIAGAGIISIDNYLVKKF